MKLKYTLAFFLLAFSTLLISQTATVFGTVTEGGTNIPIEFAIVFLKETNKNIETNAAGEYSIRVPAERAVTVRISRVGYKEAVVKIEPMRAESQRRIDVTLVNSTSQQIGRASCRERVSVLV